MPTRREFILSAAGTAVLLSVGGCAAGTSWAPGS